MLICDWSSDVCSSDLRDRLAGAVAFLQRISALGDFRQRLDRGRASLFGGHGAMPTELHASADIVGVSVIDEVCSCARRHNEGAKALQLTAPDGVLAFAGRRLVDDGFR